MDRSGVQSGSGVWGPAWKGCEISPQIGGGGLPFQSRQHREWAELCGGLPMWRCTCAELSEDLAEVAFKEKCWRPEGRPGTLAFAPSLQSGVSALG